MTPFDPTAPLAAVPTKGTRMIEVRIRHSSVAEGLHLGEIPFDKLDTVIPIISHWSIEGEYPLLTGQFVIGEIAAYFEIVIEEDAS